MESTKRRDTPCEIELRSIIHRMGLRFRVEWKIPGTRRRADIAFTATKIAVFVDGCFWHVCPLHGTWPKANGEWWRRKLLGNVQRDRDTDARLEEQGWLVLRFWEHEDMSAAAKTVQRALVRRKSDELASA